MTSKSSLRIRMLEDSDQSGFSHRGRAWTKRDRPARRGSVRCEQHHDRTYLIEKSLARLVATFMPKPFIRHPGFRACALSLFEEERVFSGGSVQICRRRTSSSLVCSRTRRRSLITNQHVNSYKRLARVGGEAPSYVCTEMPESLCLVRSLYKPKRRLQPRASVPAPDPSAGPYSLLRSYCGRPGRPRRWSSCPGRG